MVEYRKGYFARSKAGHDKGKIYIIIEETITSGNGNGDFVMVADCETKTVEKPKKKRKKHLQIVLHGDEMILEKLANEQEIRNTDIKQAIENYINHE